MKPLNPVLKRDSPERLRWFAEKFKEMAQAKREEALRLDKKAADYLVRAKKAEGKS